MSAINEIFTKEYKQHMQIKKQVKRLLLSILVMTMCITMMPCAVFASTTGSVSRTLTVSAGSVLGETPIELTVKDTSWEGTPESPCTNDIKLTFENAEWTTTPAADDNVNAQTFAGMLSVKDNADNETKIGKVVSAGNNYIELTLVHPQGLVKDNAITLTFLDGALTTLNEAGSVKIAIDGLESNISSVTLTIATVVTTITSASVTGTVKTVGRCTGETLEGVVEIRESAINSISGDQVLKLVLPKGCTWDDLCVGGNLFNTALNPGLPLSNRVSSPEDLKDSTNNDGWYSDGRNLYVRLAYAGTPTTRELVTLKSTITIGKTAATGNITVSVSSYYSAKGNSFNETAALTIAKYSTDSVKISTASSIPTIYTGTIKTTGASKTTRNKYNWVQVTLEETMLNALSHGGYIDFIFPEEVQFVQDGVSIKSTLKKTVKLADAASYGSLNSNLISWAKKSTDGTTDGDMSVFTLTIPTPGASGKEKVNDSETWSDTAANKWSIFIPVTIRADVTGAVKLKLSGTKAGIADTELTVAKAAAPISVKASTTEITYGSQKRSTANITITEISAGMIGSDTTLTADGLKKNTIHIALDDLGLNGLTFATGNIGAKVTNGDLEILKPEIDGNVIVIPIKSSSTKVSTIEISGLTAAFALTMPTGSYDIHVYGGALSDNGAYDNYGFSAARRIYSAKVEKYINFAEPIKQVTTTEPKKTTVQFQLDSADYTKDGETIPMDAAPYLDSNNRTMVPVRYVANACGISENDITWNQKTGTVSISGANTVVTITMNSSTIHTSNGTLQMDTVAVNKDGRIYVPLRYIANALGAEVTWDADTQCITLTMTETE